MKGRRIAIMAFLLVIVAGLGFSAGAQQSQAAISDDGPFVFSRMFSGQKPDFDEVLALVEEYTNTKINYRFVPNVNEWLPVAMAAGDLTDVVGMGNSQVRQPYMINAMRGGVFWDVTDHVANYPNLAAINPNIYENRSLDGRYYGLPAVRDIARRSIVYRKDWLENLGLSDPQTTEDFMEMLRAFTEDDPNRSGVKDTYGMTAVSTAQHTEITIMFGAPNVWRRNADGSFTGAWETPEFLDGLKFLREVYARGYMNQDFPIIDGDRWRDNFTSGRAGVYIRHVDEAYLVQGLMPDAKISTVTLLENPRGSVHAIGETGTNGLFSLVRRGLPTEEHLKRVLTFYDKLAEPEMANLFRYGIEGKHYRVENGRAVMIDQRLYATQVENLRNQLLSVSSTVNSMPADLDPLREYGERVKEENIEHAVFDPTLALISELNAEIGGQLTQMIDDAVVKYIIGEIDDAGWRSSVEAWRRAGGDRVAAEYAAEYAKIRR